jgi:type I restriction enzyme S subunit
MTPDKERADSRFFCNYFYSPSGLKQIYSITTGNTIQHVLASDVKELRIYAPEVGEQRKLSEFFSAINEKIRQIATQKALWVRIKSAFVQSLHNGVVSFNSRKDESFRSWKMTKLSDVLFEHKLTSIGSEEVYSVSVHKGLINQVEHLGRSFSAATTDHYNLVQPGDVVYTKSPTGEFPFGIIKQSKVESNVIVSPLYGVFTPQTKWLGHWLNAYFESAVNTSNYLKPLIQKGAKNTINITNERFLSNSLMLPVDHEEQRKISAALGAIEKKIEIVERQHQLMVSFKKGLLQKLFV